ITQRNYADHACATGSGGAFFVAGCCHAFAAQQAQRTMRLQENTLFRCAAPAQQRQRQRDARPTPYCGVNISAETEWAKP
ncbi:hypothetical protein, partial [Xanthomonas hortorum]|uniref:hypothetical protein n=1 Tax=Xanthomonas hortorum TaxID=56454 RepID=UPI002043B304